jgi:hypothetical protein
MRQCPDFCPYYRRILQHPVNAASGDAEPLRDMRRLLTRRVHRPDLSRLNRDGRLAPFVFPLGLRLSPYLIAERPRTGTPQTGLPRANVMPADPVTCGLPHDRYRVRKLLDPQNEWKNERYWDAAERLRRDFHESGLAARMCSSFEPRVSGGDGALAPDKAIEAMKRYKKAMNSVGVSLRSALWYICISGQTSEEWAIRNGKKGAEGIAVLRCELADLAHYYGYAKLDVPEPT